MPVKEGKWVPAECFEGHFSEHTGSDCDGHMELVDVRVSGGQVEHFGEEGMTFHKVSPPILTKIWACNKCDCIFEE